MNYVIIKSTKWIILPSSEISLLSITLHWTSLCTSFSVLKVNFFEAKLLEMKLLVQRNECFKMLNCKIAPQKDCTNLHSQSVHQHWVDIFKNIFYLSVKTVSHYTINIYFLLPLRLVHLSRNLLTSYSSSFMKELAPCQKKTWFYCQPGKTSKS